MPSPSPKDQDVFAPVAAEVSVRACPPSQHPSAEPVRRSGWARYLVQWALLAGVYFGAAKLGLTMASRFLWHMLRLPIAFFTQRQDKLASRVCCVKLLVEKRDWQITKSIILLKSL